MKREGNNVSIFKIEKIPILAHGAPKFGFGDGKKCEKMGKKYMKREGKIIRFNKLLGGGSNPIFSHGKMCVFPFFPMGKKYMEREGNEYFSLSFHILFSHFSIYFFSPWGKMGKHTFFHGQKWGWTPSPIVVHYYQCFLHFKQDFSCTMTWL